MGRNFLEGQRGDAANAVLAAAGYNFRRLLAWLAALPRALIAAILADDPPLLITRARLTPVPSKRDRRRGRSSRTTTEPKDVRDTVVVPAQRGETVLDY